MFITTPRHLSDLLNVDELEAAIQDGLVRKQTHPTLALSILNYTEKAQYERAWNPVTLNSRGLIIDASGTVIARPFPKFFNYSELAEPLPLDARVNVTDKLDGSLGILYPIGVGQHAVATRGSFTSDQALHATKIWNDRYASQVTPDPGFTYLFEIIYPTNRIVVDYGDLDDLVFLGAVNIATGRLTSSLCFDWPGPKAAVFSKLATLGDALAAPARPGVEGFVVHLLDEDVIVKLKQDEYIALHKAITGLNARVVWELLGQSKDLAEICEPLPDELHEWVHGVVNHLLAKAEAIHHDAQLAHQQVLAVLAEGWTRRDYALAVADSPLRPWLFNLLDARDPRPGIWRSLRPAGDRGPVHVSEDAA